VARVTSKRQVTLPKALADAHGIRPGDEIEFVSAGDSIRVEVREARRRRPSVEARLRSFDASRERQRRREGENPRPDMGGRDCTREDLYEDRGAPR